MKIEGATFEEYPSGEIKREVFEYEKDTSSESEEEIDLISRAATRKKHLFGREAPLHRALGGGKLADIVLWRNKKNSAIIFGSVTGIWVLVDWMDFHVLPLICYSLIILLSVLFIWSNTSSLIKRSPPKISDDILSEDLFLKLARVASHQINEAFITFRLAASGKDVRRFVMVVAVLWVLSVVGSWFDMLTLCYIAFVALYTGPVIYEKYEDKVDSAAEKVKCRLHKHSDVLETKVFSKLPTFSKFRLSRKQN